MFAILRASLLLGVWTIGAGAVEAAPESARTTGRFEIQEVQHAGRTHRFAVWLPPGYARDRRWPAIVFLHGAGECGDDPWAPTRIGLGPAMQARPERWPFVVVFPQKPRADQEWEELEDLVLEITKREVRKLRLDESHVALAGMSQGGHGVWMIGARHPERWSCLVPVCGYGRARSVAPRAARLPVWAFHGLRDDLVNPDDTRNITAALREERARLGLDSTGVRVTLYPNANHNSWDPAFAEDALPGWIAAQVRARRN